MIGEFKPTISPGEKPKINPIQEERDEVKYRRQFDRDLKEKKGEKGFKIIRSKMEDETVSDKQVNRKIEGMVDIEEARKIALEKLKELGFMAIEKEGDKEYLICDVDKMKKEMTWEIAKALGPAYYQEHLGDEKVLETITMAFHGIKVVSKDDYEKESRVEHDLIYSPQNKNDALDIEKIRQSKFHFLASDLFRVTRDYAKMRYGNIPTAEEDKKNGLDFREVVLPVLIYHPDYGDGYKDDEGRIFIRDNKTREFRRLTSEYIKRNWGVFGPHISGENFASPKLFIKKRLTRLAESGLLPAENFTVRIDQRNRQMTDRPNPKIKTIGGGSARVMFGGVEHIIGAEFKNKSYKVYQLSKNQAGVVDENNNILATFNIIAKDKKSSRAPGEKTNRYQAKKSDTYPQRFNKSDLFPRGINEGEGDYEKRIGEVASFKDVLQVSDKLLIEEDLRLWEEFDFKNQLFVVTLFNRVGEGNFLSFVREYGVDGLRVAASLEAGREAEKVILQLADQKKRDPKFSARLVFRKYNKIIQEKKNIQEFVKQAVPSQQLDQRDIENVTYNFDVKARKILEDFSTRVDKLSVDEVENKLEKIRKNLMLLGSLMAHFKEHGIPITPENIRDMKIETKEVGELNGEEKEKFLEHYEKEIMAMVEDNYSKVFAENPAAKEKVTRNFGERLENLEKYRVHTLTFQGELVAVMTMHPEGENEVMAESFIVHPDAKHYSLGIAFAKEIMKQESVKNTVHSKVRADNAAIIKTHENWGFIFDREHPFEEEKVEYIKMRLEKGEFRES